MKYAFNNKLIGKSSVIKKEDIMNTRYIINGEELSKESKEEILKYMEDRNIPFIQGAFGAVKNKYLAGELKPVKAKTLEKVTNN